MVFSLRNRRLAISLLVIPSATSSRIDLSRSVRLATPIVADRSSALVSSLSRRPAMLGLT